jgi:hypothetical protein
MFPSRQASLTVSLAGSEIASISRNAASRFCREMWEPARSSAIPASTRRTEFHGRDLAEIDPERNNPSSIKIRFPATDELGLSGTSENITALQFLGLFQPQCETTCSNIIRACSI